MSIDHLALGKDEAFHAAVAAMVGAGSGREEVLFSDNITKINRRGTAQARALVVTDAAYYNIRSASEAGAIRRRIPYEALGAVSVSDMAGELVLHVPSEYDYLLKSARVPQILSAIETAYKAAMRRELLVHRHSLGDLSSICETKDVKKKLKAAGKQTNVLTNAGPPSPAVTGGGGGSGGSGGGGGGGGAGGAGTGDAEEPEEGEEDDTVSELKDSGAVSGWATSSTKVNLDSFDLLKVIGRGSFGKVMLVRHKETGATLAMKVLRKEAILKRNQVEHTQSERAILEAIDHPFLVKLRYAFQSKTKLYMVLDYLTGGELFFHLKTSRRFSEDRARFYAAEIAMGIGHLHEKGMIYRDLKPENILLDAEGHVRLTDFGLSKRAVTGQEAKTFCGTPEYLAPEIILDKGHGKEVDWWSLGVVMYEMMCGLPPHYTDNVQLMYRRIVSTDATYPAFLSEDAVSILRGLLDRDPMKRLGHGETDVGEIRAHPWMASLDWDALYAKEIAPPFKPKVKGEGDTSNFDTEFTSEPVVDSVVPTSALDGATGAEFSGFTFAEKSAMDG